MPSTALSMTSTRSSSSSSLLSSSLRVQGASKKKEGVQKRAREGCGTDEFQIFSKDHVHGGFLESTDTTSSFIKRRKPLAFKLKT
ncbi:hypothetical protein HMI54_012092 [Coelomomyces lativittatus]|nr:hypothetical protein HMI54_012092 [Coelomomyces lativittatus]